MATVPVIQDSEQLQTGTGRQRIQADASSFGGLEARALGNVAQGLDKIDAVVKQKNDEADELNARELDNELTRAMRERLYNPQTGYVSSQRGRNAIDGQAQVEADLDGIAATMASRARSPQARAMFERAARQRVLSGLGDVSTHATRETQAYENDIFETGVNEATDGAVAAYGDAAAVEQNVQRGIGAIRAFGGRRGWAPDVIQSREEAFRSGVMSRVIVQLATTDPTAADELFTQIRPSLSAQDAGELRTTMRAAQAQAREQVTGAVWQALANNEDPRALPQWHEFETNPLFGREHEQFNEYRRQRAREAAAGLHQQSNTPAYWEAHVFSLQSPQMFVRALPSFLSRHPEISREDIGRLMSRAEEIRQGGGANGQVSVFNAVRSVAEPLVGFDLSPTQGEFRNNETALTRAQEQSRAFDASLAQVVAGFVEQNRGRQPNPEETQMLIGQALIQMRAGAPQGVRTGDVAGQAVMEAFFIPYDRIPQSDRSRIQAMLARRYPNAVTRQMVEQTYQQYRAETASGQ